MNTTIKVGKYVRQRRTHLRISLPRLSALTGVQKSTISKLENGKGDPQLSTIVSLADGLKVSAGHMLKVAFNERI